MKLFLKNFLLIGFFLTSFSYPLKAQEDNNQQKEYLGFFHFAIIYEMSPLFLVLLSSLLFSKEKRFKRLTLWDFIFIYFWIDWIRFCCHWTVRRISIAI